MTPPLKLVNDCGHESSVVTPRVAVNNLTASWTNVREFNDVYAISSCAYVCRIKRKLF